MRTAPRRDRLAVTIAFAVLTCAYAQGSLGQSSVLEACNAIADADKRLACLKELQSLQPKAASANIADTGELTALQAQACIDQVRPSLKDPQSAALVSILGARGMSQKARGGGVWIQYKATNSYGGFITKSILCHPDASMFSLAEAARQTCVIKVAGELVRRPGFYDSVPGATIRYQESQSQYVNRREREVVSAALGQAETVVSGIADLKPCDGEGS